MTIRQLIFVIIQLLILSSATSSPTKTGGYANRIYPNKTEIEKFDPELQQYQDMMIKRYSCLPPYNQSDIKEVRRAADLTRFPNTLGGPIMRRIDEIYVGNYPTRIRIYYPTTAFGMSNSPALIYIHGGGWTTFSLNTHDRIMREYAGRAGVIVIGVDYSLSPEVKFPRAIEEIVSVVQWLREHGVEYNVDPLRIAIGGDSAGPNLCMATNLQLSALKQPTLSAQILNYGVYDRVRLNSTSYKRYDGANYSLSVEDMNFFWQQYIRNEQDYDNPLVCPLHADLRGMPPSFLAITQYDILYDENRAMAKALRKAGVKVKERVYPGTTHGFLDAIQVAVISGRAIDDAAHWLQQQLGVKISKT